MSGIAKSNVQSNNECALDPIRSATCMGSCLLCGSGEEIMRERGIVDHCEDIG